MLRKITKKVLLCSLILFCTGLFSCDDKCKDITYLPQGFLNYWFFNQDSYWIYQSNDSTTTVFDTVSVVGANKEVEPPAREQERPSCVEWALLTLEHSCTTFYNTQPTYPFTRIYSYYDLETKEFFCVSNFTGLSFDRQWYLFYSAEGNNYIQSDDPSEWELIENTTLNTPSGTFENVLHYKLVNQMDLFIAPGVGIIKIITSNSQVWELVQYNVSQ